MNSSPITEGLLPWHPLHRQQQPRCGGQQPAAAQLLPPPPPPLADQQTSMTVAVFSWQRSKTSWQ
jgi:hypothetical protein